VPTAVAGIYGINFDMPGLKLVWVYPACLGFIAVAYLMLFLRERVTWPDERLMA
jgi:Mg2+ and Co2+ transporter CorA